MAEMEVAHEPELLERVEVAVDRREVGARQASVEPAGDRSALTGPSAANSASSTSRRADDTRRPRARRVARAAAKLGAASGRVSCGTVI